MGQKKTTIQTGAWSPSWGYSLEASASMAQYPTTDNKRIGTAYPNGRSSVTSNGNDSTTNVSEASASALKYPTNENRTNKGTNYYGLSGSFQPFGPATIPTTGISSASLSITFTTASWDNLGNAELYSASAAANNIVKIAITSSYFDIIQINDSNVTTLYLSASANINSTLNTFNFVSSSITDDVNYKHIVMYASASKTNMGNVVTSNYQIFNPIIPSRFVRTKTNVTDIAAYVAKYPNNTTKAGWVDGVSPKNQ
jgi:hypothetical protein